MTKRTPEQTALQLHLEAMLRTFPLTSGDYDTDGDLTEEALDRLWEQVLPQLSEAERQELAQEGLEDEIVETVDELVAEGKAEKYTDEYGELHFRLLDAS